jgi:CheY-like chemotaxis protein
MRTVLIADDHEVTRRGIREILQDEFPGVEIVEVGDGAAVLAQLHARKWDLILLDVMMPGGTIVDLLRKIRATHADVPALVLTAATEVEYVTHDEGGRRRARPQASRRGRARGGHKGGSGRWGCTCTRRRSTLWL